MVGVIYDLNQEQSFKERNSTVKIEKVIKATMTVALMPAYCHCEVKKSLLNTCSQKATAAIKDQHPSQVAFLLTDNSNGWMQHFHLFVM